MVKKAISGKGRRGAPPLPRQRGALRVVQVTLLLLGAFLAYLAYESWVAYREAVPNAGLDEAVALGAAAALAAGGALWMGIRTVRGPQPPSLE